MSKTVTKASDTPDSHKIAVYEALRRHFGNALGDYYTSPAPNASQYDTELVAEQTECIGIEVQDDALYVVMAIEGWADLHGFAVALPSLTRDDHQDEGTVLTLDVEEP